MQGLLKAHLVLISGFWNAEECPFRKTPCAATKNTPVSDDDYKTSLSSATRADFDVIFETSFLV